MVANYNVSEATFKWDIHANWHVSFAINNIRISYELTQDFIVLSWIVMCVFNYYGMCSQVKAGRYLNY